MRAFTPRSHCGRLQELYRVADPGRTSSLSRLKRTRPLKVERRFYLAGTYICQQAMLAGRIDIYPEYTGTALTAILKQKVGGDRPRSTKE